MVTVLIKTDLLNPQTVSDDGVTEIDIILEGLGKTSHPTVLQTM